MPPFSYSTFCLLFFYVMKGLTQIPISAVPLWLLAACVGVVAGCGPTISIDPEITAGLPETIDYNYHIKPLLSDRCYACHGPDDNARKADLRLYTEEGAKHATLESGGRAIVPGSLRRSQLYHRIYADDPDAVMPPPESNLTLSDYEKALIARWIKQGAQWKPHWAFIPPDKPDLPEVTHKDWPTGGIDAFILARLEREGLRPSPEAARETLIRRVTFDLTGLPPTLDEIDAFLTDDSPDAYETVVDRLLASEAYGERMAVEWLDAARYADTGGYQSDRLRRMWPWRDWVIEAFNENLPFDEFATWQLAGDLLPNATTEQRLATAFNRNHRQTEEGGSIDEEFRVEYVADRTNTTATTFLGLTMECARCHDHKYDPISQKDYYQLFSFFNNIDESGQTSFFTDAVPVPALLLLEEETEHRLIDLKEQITEKEQELKTLIDQARPDFEAWRSRQAAAALPATPTPGSVAAYDFEQIVEGKVSNRVRPDRPGTTVYEPRIVPGRFGNAMAFDGENGLHFDGVGDFTRAAPFTLSLWIKAAEWRDWNVLVHRTRAALDAGSRGYELSMQHDRLVAGLTHMWPQNAIRVVTTDALPLNEWVHVAMTYDASSRAEGVTLYVNGERAAVTVLRDNLFKNITYERDDATLTMGYRFRDSGFKDGLIDDFQVFDRALTAIEVAQLHGVNPLPALLKKPSEARTETEREQLFAYFLAYHHPDDDRAQAELHTLRRTQDETISPVPEIMVMQEMATPRPAYVLRRGRYDDRGEEVVPGTPARIMSFPDDLPKNRLGLARWLVDPQNPLTARVAANRYWQMYFGQGLVATPEDFGNQGALPTHPHLLDWLARSFIESGWDVKAMQKQIVMSATYRQSSAATPELMARDSQNRLLARGPSFRLSAEMIRDQALAASGLLVRTIGGPGVKPYQPAGLWEEKSGKKYVQDTGDGLYRRSLYTFWKRTSPPPSMITFDAARRNQCVMRRQRTSTPMQALVLLNDPQFVEASRKIAERMLREGGETVDERITFAFRLLTSRRPRPAERDVLKALYQEQQEAFARDRSAALALLETGESGWDDSLDLVALASSTLLANTLLNFDESIIKR